MRLLAGVVVPHGTPRKNRLDDSDLTLLEVDGGRFHGDERWKQAAAAQRLYCALLYLGSRA